MAKTLDIVVPIYNEEDCIEELLSRLKGVRERLASELDIRFILVNDGSSDSSKELIEKAAANSKHIKFISFSRNFGHELAVTAGLDYSNADYTAIIDADLQDPPELIVDMYDKLKEGYQIVYGQRLKRKSESLFKKITAYLFYRVLNSLCETKLPLDTGDFRIMTSDVRNAVIKIKEHKRFMRGILSWVGFKSTAVQYNRDERFAGSTKYSPLALVRLAFVALFEMSTAPITLVNWLSCVLFIAAMILFALHSNIIASIMLAGSIQVAAIAVIGAYVVRIYEESKDRPLYIVDKTINFEKDN